MKILSLKISNVLSFKFHQHIDDAQAITFNDDLNIIIGENGSGKSTALETINFLFKKIFLQYYIVNEGFLKDRDTIDENAKKETLRISEDRSFTGFRLEPNWNSSEKPQEIQIKIALDSVDIDNINIIISSLPKTTNTLKSFSKIDPPISFNYRMEYTFNITLNRSNKSFSTNCIEGQDFGFIYLTNYNYYKQLFRIHSLIHPTDLIQPLNEIFTIIGGYRNYNSFSKSVGFSTQLAPSQILDINQHTFNQSLNKIETSEPNIFKIVRLRVAEHHYDLYQSGLSESEREDKANNLPFIKSINDKLDIVHLECRIKLINQQSWQYSFFFIDKKRNKELGEIDVLSAGQKAIIHLIFEAYGQGQLKGGLIIIDEPEIHLHYQFQEEYMRILKQLNSEQKCQYIIVTHSDALINSDTIKFVKRFSLTNDGFTKMCCPILSTDQKTLIKILDNTRTTYAFFAKKILLVEGDSDRYFFKSIFHESYNSVNQEIAVLYIGGKGSYTNWNALFTSFGMEVYFIADFDFIINQNYPTEKGTKLTDVVSIRSFKAKYPDWETKINSDYSNKIFILKNGDLEHYLKIQKKDLLSIIDFCNNNLSTFLNDNNNIESCEIMRIIAEIIK